MHSRRHDGGMNMVRLLEITPTLFFKGKEGALKQLIRVVLANDGTGSDVVLRIRMPNLPESWQPLHAAAGTSVHEIYIPDITQACIAVFAVIALGVQCDCREIEMPVQRKWVVHVVQASHHDVGYTDLPSLVLREHDRNLDEAIDLAEATADYPEDAQFRIIIEQAWSVDHFLRHMSADRVGKMVTLMQAGRFELTALFGNMTTELCGHETLARAAYHAFNIRRKYGIPVISAEHNDITGISWGLSRVLTDAGVKIFCPGIPLYYSWGQNAGMPSFWDQKKIFGREGPGAFWWESPAGKRVLFWCNNTGCGGSALHTLPELEEALIRNAAQGYPWTVVRWPVGGGHRDNSPYIGGYAQTIKAWNEKWAYPHLVCSTNAKFHDDFVRQDLSGLPVWRGELPGQDYPSGATSTAAATAANRNAHSALISAEKLSTLASRSAERRYPADLLAEAYEETLWHDEHTWGYHFPCGPAMRASRREKELHAYRAEALAHGTASKAMSAIADHVHAGEGFHLVVFNPSSWDNTGIVEAPLREMDNSGSEMHFVAPEKDRLGIGFLKGYVLGDRFHTILPPGLVDGVFSLQDTVTGTEVPFQIREIASPMDAVPYSEDRLGIGTGTKRYGGFEVPSGVKRDLCFLAQDVPAMGWKTFRLVPRGMGMGGKISLDLQASSGAQNDCDGQISPDAQNTADAENADMASASQSIIENDHYRVTVDAKGILSSITDKQVDRELVDGTMEHGFFSLLVRQGNSLETTSEQCLGVSVETGPVFSEIRIRSLACGHPAIEKRITLYDGIREIHFAMKVLKDPTPLLNAHIGFPFAAENPQFRYEGCLSVMDPVKDFLPGSFSDTIAVQNWVKVKDGGRSILWSSLDAPIAGFGRLWPGYVSPAHRAMLDAGIIHNPQKEVDFSTGHIYSQVFNNNFGTNFSVSQTGEALFRYVLTTVSRDVTDSEAAKFGWQAVTPLNQILTDRARPVAGRDKGTEVRKAESGAGSGAGAGSSTGSGTGSSLALSGSFMKSSNDKVAILTCKKAEDGNGTILRLWNLAGTTERAKVIFPLAETIAAMRTNLCEEGTGDMVFCFGNTMDVEIGAEDILTIRVSGL